MAQRELLILQPADDGPAIWQEDLRDYWLILGKLGVTSVMGHPTVTRRHCYGLMLAQLVLDEVDFEFDDQHRVPAELPDDLTPYRNVLIYTEDFERHAPRLLGDFPDAETYVAKLREQPHPCHFTTSRDGERRLMVRPLTQLVTSTNWGFPYWSLELTMGAPGFRRRQLARPIRQLIDRTLERVLAAAADPDWLALYPPFKGGQILGREWSEVTAIQQRIYLELGELLGDRRFHDIGEQSIRRFFAEADWRKLPGNAGKWGIVAPVACLYAQTGEPQLRDFIRYRFEQREREWGVWRGCFGSFPKPADRWLRDAPLSALVASGVIAAGKLDDSDLDRDAIYRQAVHQSVTTEEVLRDPATGWYRFGADGERHTPSFATHSSYWHIFANANLLTHLPPETPGYDRVVAVYRRLAEALADAQGPEGLWHMHLDRVDPGMGDAGYTAAITGSLLRGLGLGVLDPDRFGPVVRRGVEGYKLRCFDGCQAGGVVSCPLTPSPRYYYSRTPWEELNYGTWQQLFLIAELLRYPQFVP